jgi:hypothetical protein
MPDGFVCIRSLFSRLVRRENMFDLFRTLSACGIWSVDYRKLWPNHPTSDSDVLSRCGHALPPAQVRGLGNLLEGRVEGVWGGGDMTLNQGRERKAPMGGLPRAGSAGQDRGHFQVCARKQKFCHQGTAQVRFARALSRNNGFDSRT